MRINKFYLFSMLLMAMGVSVISTPIFSMEASRKTVADLRRVIEDYKKNRATAINIIDTYYQIPNRSAAEAELRKLNITLEQLRKEAPAVYAAQKAGKALPKGPIKPAKPVAKVPPRKIVIKTKPTPKPAIRVIPEPKVTTEPVTRVVPKPRPIPADFPGFPETTPRPPKKTIPTPTPKAPPIFEEPSAPSVSKPKPEIPTPPTPPTAPTPDIGKGAPPPPPPPPPPGVAPSVKKPIPTHEEKEVPKEPTKPEVKKGAPRPSAEELQAELERRKAKAGEPKVTPEGPKTQAEKTQAEKLKEELLAKKAEMERKAKAGEPKITTPERPKTQVEKTPTEKLQEEILAKLEKRRSVVSPEEIETKEEEEEWEV